MNGNEEVKYFGKSDKFKIRYIPANQSNPKLSNLKLIIENQLIGDNEELSNTSSWVYSLQKLKSRILNRTESDFVGEFKNKSYEEIFQLIAKSNQLEEEFDPKYKYLPKLNPKLWSNSNISLDETIDAWIIYWIANKDNIIFLWKGWRSPCKEEFKGKIFQAVVDKSYLIQTIDDFLIEINAKYIS